MLIIDSDIIRVLTAQLAAVQFNLKIIMYSISPATKTSHKAIKLYWQELLSAIKRCKNCEIILSSWPKENPQASATKSAARQLSSAGATVKMGKMGTITHPKSWQFDNKNLLIGSHNATSAGLLSTKNLSILTQDSSAINDYNDYFDSLSKTLIVLKD
jgi:PLD-like domain